MKNKVDKNFNNFINKIDKASAKHLVKLGIEKDWKKTYEKMQKRRRQRERTT